MKKFVGFIAALLLSGVAGLAFAQTPPSAPAASAACTGPDFTWQRLGGDPFATSEAEAMRKLPQALARAVALGCMPQHIADNFLTQVRENPQGTLVTIVPGAKLAFMESGKHPILNVTVGRNVVSAASGLVVSIEAKGWSARDEATGIVYQWMMPFVCFNWSLMVTVPQAPPPPAPPAEPECVVSNRAVRGATDAYVHVVGFRVSRSNECLAWRYAGETEWREITDCDTDCVYDARFRAVAVQKIGNADMTFTMKVPVIGDGVVQIRMPREALDASTGIALADCLEELSGAMSDSVYTRSDDYHYYSQWNQYVASVFRTQESIPDTWTERELYFRFSQR